MSAITVGPPSSKLKKSHIPPSITVLLFVETPYPTAASPPVAPSGLGLPLPPPNSTPTSSLLLFSSGLQPRAAPPLLWLDTPTPHPTLLHPPPSKRVTPPCFHHPLLCAVLVLASLFAVAFAGMQARIGRARFEMRRGNLREARLILSDAASLPQNDGTLFSLWATLETREVCIVQ